MAACAYPAIIAASRALLRFPSLGIPHILFGRFTLLAPLVSTRY
jgi:hypothetical protein